MLKEPTGIISAAGMPSRGYLFLLPHIPLPPASEREKGVCLERSLSVLVEPLATETKRKGGVLLCQERTSESRGAICGSSRERMPNRVTESSGTLQQEARN